MSKNNDSEAKRALARGELKTVTGGAPTLSNLSSFQVKRRDETRPSEFTEFDGDSRELLQGFGQPVVRPPSDLQYVDPDWVSDSISVQVACVGWSKDYTEPPPPPPPPDPDGGTGGGGGGGGAPGRFEGFDLPEGIGGQLGRGGGLNRG